MTAPTSPPLPGHRYVLGVDVAEGEDQTSVALFDATSRTFLLVEMLPSSEDPVEFLRRRYDAKVAAERHP